MEQLVKFSLRLKSVLDLNFFLLFILIKSNSTSITHLCARKYPYETAITEKINTFVTDPCTGKRFNEYQQEDVYLLPTSI